MSWDGLKHRVFKEGKSIRSVRQLYSVKSLYIYLFFIDNLHNPHSKTGSPLALYCTNVVEFITEKLSVYKRLRKFFLLSKKLDAFSLITYREMHTNKLNWFVLYDWLLFLVKSKTLSVQEISSEFTWDRSTQIKGNNSCHITSFIYNHW